MAETRGADTRPTEVFELVDETGDGAPVSRGAATIRLDGGVGVIIRAGLLDPDRDASRLWELIRTGCSRRTVHYAVRRQDPTGRAVHAVAGGELQSTRMDKQLDGQVPSTGIDLVPMTAEQFAPWAQRQQEEYARTRAANGESREVAERTSREQHAALFPGGVGSPGQRVFTAHRTDAGLGASNETDGDSKHGTVIGTLWVDDSAPEVFIYNVEIDPRFQGRGLGRALMLEAERWCRAHDRTTLVLNVFGNNVRARNLYDSLGYTALVSGYGVDLDA